MALKNLPDPRLLDWVVWSDAVVAQNPHAARVIEVAPGISDPAAFWRDTADRLCELESTTPRHDSFTDWREWAICLMSVNGG